MRLGLVNSVHTGELVERLAHGPLAKQLVALDLSRGTLDDAELAKVIAAGPKRFPSLATISVAETYVTRAGVRALEKAFPKLEVSAKDRRTLDASDPDDERYVAVGE